MEPHPNANKKPFDVSDKKFKKLCADIRKNGMQEEIVICDDKLLDGRYRQAAIKKLYADGSLPENFEVKYRIHADTETYLAKDVNLSQNYLRQNHTQFECAVAVVWDNWHLHGPLSEAAKARKLKGKPAKKNERGTVDEKFAEMAGVNENYASIAIGLRKYDERLREVVDREQLNHSTAQKFNRLTKKQKGKYLQYFLGNPTANFADAHSEFKEEEKKKAEKPNKVKEVVPLEYELLEMPLDEEKHPVDILRDQTDHFLDNFHFSGILPYRVCPDFVNEYAELGRSFGYLTERSVLFMAQHQKRHLTPKSCKNN